MNILLIQLKRIGDLILTTPAIAAVRTKFPRANISLIVSAGTRELLPAIPGSIAPSSRAGKSAMRPPGSRSRRRKYDYCLDFTRTDRSAFLTLLSGARKRITYGPSQAAGEDSRVELQRIGAIADRPHAHGGSPPRLARAARNSRRTANRPVESAGLGDGTRTPRSGRRESARRVPFVCIRVPRGRRNFGRRDRWAALIDHCEPSRD